MTDLSAGICLCKLFVCARECLCAYVISFSISQPTEAELDLNVVQEKCEEGPPQSGAE